MRRISILALILLFSVSSVARSRYYGYRRFRIPVRYRTRHSPYAVGHNRTGLISGHLRYSPYALGRNSSGLVPDNVRYSPYALGRSSSGLVPDNVRYSPYALGRNSSGLVPDNVRYSPYALGHDRSGLVADSYYPNYYANYYHHNIIISDEDTYQQTSKPSWEITFHHNDFQKHITAPKDPDGKNVIYKYLKSKKIDFKMDRVFVIGSKTISVNFILKDKNVLIKYWNLENIEEIINQSYSNNIMYNKYLRTWTTLLEDYQKAGLNVFEINSPGQKEILSRLDRLSELNG